MAKHLTSSDITVIKKTTSGLARKINMGSALYRS